MSNVSNRHQINPFISGKSEPLTGQRLCKVGYKKTAKQTNPLASICVSLPQIDPAQIVENVQRLLPYIGTMLESAQDGIVRSLYEASGGNLSTVSDDELSISACIGWMESEATGGRLSKEYLESWFDSQMADNLTVTVSEKLGFDLSTPEQEETVAKHVRVYKALIASLAGGKTILQDKQIVACQRALDIASVEDDTSAKLRARLQNMQNKPKLEDMLEL